MNFMEMVIRIIFCISAVIIFCTSCIRDEELVKDMEGFKPIAEPYPFSRITTVPEVDYWEVSHSSGDEDTAIVVASWGNRCSLNGFQDTCSIAYDFVSDSIGSFYFCYFPPSCYKYFIRYEYMGVVKAIWTHESLVDFLGSIDTKDDCLLLIHMNEYNFLLNDIDNGAIRKVDEGFEVIARKRLSDCPVQTARFHLFVSEEGDIEILNRIDDEVAGGCF